MPKNPMSPDEVALLWDMYGAGEIVSVIARRLKRPFPSVNERVLNAGGIRPLVAQRPARALTAAEREEISRGLAAGASLRCIARSLGRPASTISREVARNGGRRGYRAARAERSAVLRRRRPKASKLAVCHELRQVVEDKLALEWSPGQIQGWLRDEFPERCGSEPCCRYPGRPRHPCATAGLSR